MVRLEDFLVDLEPGYEIEIPKWWITEPPYGWKPRYIGLPREGSVGQIYKGRFHAHDMGDYYLAHVDNVDPDVDPIGHILKDTPKIAWIGAGITAAALIWALSRQR
jgi:hypothetical protein